MSAKDWYIHIQGETFGPLSTDIVALMLRQNRLQFSDFLWASAYTRWTRIWEVAEFAPLMPQYPTAPLPSPNEGGYSGYEAMRGPAKPRVRRFPRVPIETRFVTADYGTFEVHNLSEGGLYVKSSTILLPIGTHLVFRLDSLVEGEVNGVVVRFGSANDPAGFGIEFTRLTEAQRERLRAIVSARQDNR